MKQLLFKRLCSILVIVQSLVCISLVLYQLLVFLLKNVDALLLDGQGLLRRVYLYLELLPLQRPVLGLLVVVGISLHDIFFVLRYLLFCALLQYFVRLGFRPRLLQVARELLVCFTQLRDDQAVLFRNFAFVNFRFLHGADESGSLVDQLCVFLD